MSSREGVDMARNGIMHHARLENSPRLKKLLAALSDGQWHSTAELSHRCHNYAVGTSISELRANGKLIEAKHVRAEISGQRWFEYQLTVDKGQLTRKNPCQGCQAYFTANAETKVCGVEAVGACAMIHPLA